ncbi:helix-turn-helix domain-containing protein [Aggregatilinea lenta]|uniref:helix-turn-helix domain-containing protein n=1 Tax=Aggregatilinea lenta TaxID=913108 RepID=UPI000E5A9719
MGLPRSLALPKQRAHAILLYTRARYAAGVSQAELARQFGISYQRVHQIVQRKRR